MERLAPLPPGLAEVQAAAYLVVRSVALMIHD